MYAFRPAGADMHRPIIMSVYGSDIAVRLKRIYRHAERHGPNGWLVVALHGRRPAFVRCQFAPPDKLMCKVSSGSYPSAGGEADRPSPVLTEALKGVGYWPDAHGQPVFEYEITPDSGVWGGAANVILSSLIEAFHARATSKIDIIAPLAQERDEAAIRREMRGL